MEDNGDEETNYADPAEMQSLVPPAVGGVAQPPAGRYESSTPGAGQMPSAQNSPFPNGSQYSPQPPPRSAGSHGYRSPGTESGGVTPGTDLGFRKRRPPTGSSRDSQSFSARLANASAAANNSAARLAEVIAARRARQVKRYQGGRVLLQQLQEESGSKDPSVLAGVLQAPPSDPRYTPPTFMGAMKAKLFGAPQVPDPRNARVEIGDPIQVKKSMSYKMNALKRRTEQQMLVSMGVRAKRPDEEFAHLWARVQRQEHLLNKIREDGARYAKAISEASSAAVSMAGHIAELAETDLNLYGSSRPEANHPGGGSSSGGSGHVTPIGGASPSRVPSRAAVVARARQLTEVMHALENDVRPVCVDHIAQAVTLPASRRCDDFPSYQPCVDKRRNYMLDMDAYERKLQKARASARDPAEVPHREEQFSRAQRRFTHFSDKLEEDLTLVDTSRFEVAHDLLEGFVESQQFMLDQQAKVMRLMETRPI